MKVLLAITGASGSIYGTKLLEALLRSRVQVTLVPSKNGLEVCRFETGIELADPAALKKLWNLPEADLTIRSADDIWAVEASGSAAPDAMVIAPCSMGTMGRIAAGISGNLIERAADVMLKERKPLVLAPRETPFSLIHIENMHRLALAGARIVPAMPAFYHKPESIDDLTDFVAGKLLDQLGVANHLFKRWGE